jgi:hypothetical protein
MIDYSIGYINTLTDIYICSTDAPTLSGTYSGKIVFRKTPTENITLHVNASAIDAYKVEPWPTFMDIVALTNDEIAKSESNDEEYIPLTENIIKYKTDSETKTAEVTGCILIDSKLVIPSTIIKEDITYTVTGIGDDAFQYYNIESVTLPSTITYLGARAFGYNANLKEINFPEGLKSIGQACFAMCPLTSVIFPNSLETIGRAAFGGMPQISFTIPAGVKEIGPAAFNDAAAIKVAEGNTVYDSRNNCNAVIETATNTLVSMANTATIPYGIQKIGNWSVNNVNHIDKVYIPATVTTIGLYNFIYNENLTDVYCYAEKVPAMENDYRSRNEITLHVPATAVSDYTSSWENNNFKAIVAMTDKDMEAGIESIQQKSENIQKICDLNGRSISTLRKGLNIVTLSNGRTAKVICK